MSEYFFGVLGQYDKLDGGTKTAKKRDKLAKSIDGKAGYVYFYDDAEKRWRGWGYCPNMGHPFDQATAKQIEDAWKVAGV